MEQKGTPTTMFYNSLQVALSNINNLRHFLPRSVSTSVGEVIDHNLPFFELLLLQGLSPFNCNKTSPGIKEICLFQGSFSPNVSCISTSKYVFVYIYVDNAYAYGHYCDFHMFQRIGKMGHEIVNLSCALHLVILHCFPTVPTRCLVWVHLQGM